MGKCVAALLCDRVPKLKIIACLGATLAAVLTTASSSRGAYTYTSIADTDGPYSRFNSFSIAAGPFGTASASDGGVVAFWAELDGGGEGAFAGSGGSVTTLASTAAGGGYSNVGENPSINASGTVGFSAVATGGSNSVYARSSTGGSTTLIASPTGALDGIPNNPTFNSNDQAAFRASRAGTNTGEGIYRGSTGGLVEIVVGDNAPDGSDFDIFGPSPGINSTGMVAFQARYFGNANSGVFIGNGTGGITTIADSFGSTFSHSFGNPDINDPGTVVFRAGLDAGGTGVFNSTAGVITTVADTSGIFSSFGNVDINNAGVVAFAAHLDAGGSGIYTSADGRVIGTGDALFGSTVTGLAFVRGLNNGGNIAFVYQLADGRQGVALAVPEPGAVALVSAAAGVLLLKRRRRVM